MASIKANTDGLDKILANLKDDYFLRVGILGSRAHSSHDKDSRLTNAEIGTFHEFGTNKMPRRSFLEDSLKFKLNFGEDQMKEFKKVIFKQLFVKGATLSFFQDLGAKALEVIEEGFATGGFGMWKRLSDVTYARRSAKLPKRVTKRSLTYWFKHPILTDTGKLRRSISFKVMNKK